jgi:hypothetical protein
MSGSRQMFPERTHHVGQATGFRKWVNLAAREQDFHV